MKKDFINKLDSIFVIESESIYSYTDNKEHKEVPNEFEKEFIKMAKTYTDELTPLYRSGDEWKIRKELIRVELEILKKLKADKRFSDLKMPEHWANKVRIATGGFDLDKNKKIS
jgi:hypothetical protein